MVDSLPTYSGYDIRRYMILSNVPLTLSLALSLAQIQRAKLLDQIGKERGLRRNLAPPLARSLTLCYGYKLDKF